MKTATLFIEIVTKSGPCRDRHGKTTVSQIYWEEDENKYDLLIHDNLNINILLFQGLQIHSTTHSIMALNQPNYDEIRNIN